MNRAAELPAVPGRHVYVVAGDVMNLACDAWLLPTDVAFNVTASFAGAVGLGGSGTIPDLEWKDSRVLRLDHAGPGPQIWLGNLGRASSDPEWHSACVEPFVREACAQLPPRPGGLPPLLALPVLGSGEGGSGRNRGGVHEVLLPTLYQAVAQHHADVALVCFDRESYSAAQRVRQRLLEGRDQTAFWNLGPGGRPWSVMPAAWPMWRAGVT